MQKGCGLQRPTGSGNEQGASCPSLVSVGESRVLPALKPSSGFQNHILAFRYILSFPFYGFAPQRRSQMKGLHPPQQKEIIFIQLGNYKP